MHDLNCFLCLNSNTSLKTVLQNDTASQVKYVLPELIISNPIRICSLCCSLVQTFYTFKKTCLENYSCLMKTTNTLQATNVTQSQKFHELVEQELDLDTEVNIKEENEDLSLLQRKQGDSNMLFKIVAPDRLSKIMVKGDNINDIIMTAKVKFNLHGENYKLALMDDKILMEYVEQYKMKSNEPISLLLLTDDTLHTSQDKQTTSNAPNNLNDSTSDLNQDLKTHVWSKAPLRLITVCKEGRKAHPKDRKLLVGLVADYLSNELNDTTRKTCTTISQMICKEYPNTFNDLMEDQFYGLGSESLFLQIYNAVLYRKTSKKSAKKRTVTKKDEDEDEERKQLNRNVLKQDEYGCVDYSPQLPHNETAKTQGAKRVKLVGMFSSLNQNEVDIALLMDETYPTQRARINAVDRNMIAIATDWPFLKMPQYLTQHFNRLIGKHVSVTWSSFAETKLIPLRQYLMACKYKEERKTAVSQVIKSYKEACTVTKSNNPKTLVIFQLLLLYFNEDEKYLFNIIDVDVPDKDIAKQAECDNPVLLIRGHSFFDEDPKCTLILERSIVIPCKDVLQGIIVLFASYFVFGYAYPSQVEKTLEYIQREIMKINPTSGHKRANKRRKSMSYDAIVFKLAKEVADFHNQ